MNTFHGFIHTRSPEHLTLIAVIDWVIGISVCLLIRVPVQQLVSVTDIPIPVRSDIRYTNSLGVTDKRKSLIVRIAIKSDKTKD
jgi:hypothetical protein